MIGKPAELPLTISSQVETSGGILLLVDGSQLQPATGELSLQANPATVITSRDVYVTMRELDRLLDGLRRGDASAFGKAQTKVSKNFDEIAAKLRGTSEETRRQLTEFIGDETFALLSNPQGTSFEEAQKAWAGRSREIKRNWLGAQARFQIGTEGAELRIKGRTVSLWRISSVSSVELQDAIPIDIGAFKKFKGSSTLSEIEQKEIAYIDYVAGEIIQQRTAIQENPSLGGFIPDRVYRDHDRTNVSYKDATERSLTLWLERTPGSNPQIRGEISFQTHRKTFGARDLLEGAKLAFRARSLQRSGFKLLTSDSSVFESLALSETSANPSVIETEHVLLLPNLADAQNALDEAIGGPIQATSQMVEVRWDKPMPCWFISNGGDLLQDQLCEILPVAATVLVELVPR